MSRKTGCFTLIDNKSAKTDHGFFSAFENY